MTVTVDHAMVLAAGFGKRMHPLTLDRPKPMIEVAGQPLIAYAFDALRAANVSHAIVNVHYLGYQIADWCRLQKSPAIEMSDERDVILDTGGGIAHALPKLGNSPFFVLNSDSFWQDASQPALQRLMANWRSADMDCLLLLSPVDRTIGYDGKGDFHCDDSGRLTRIQNPQSAVFAYIGAYLVHPRLFLGSPGGSFSMNKLWDKAIMRGRLFGLIHDGWWLHVGTPDAIPLAERHLRYR